jgi:hypothetical protein
MRKLAIIASLSVLTGCQTIVTTPPADCLSFIPDSWKLAIPGAPLPADDELKSWQVFGVEQSGQLTKANGRTADVIHIVSVCEKKANDARPRRKFLGLL